MTEACEIAVLKGAGKNARALMIHYSPRQEVREMAHKFFELTFTPSVKAAQHSWRVT